MLDFENRIFTLIKNELLKEYPDISISSDITLAPKTMPHVTILETENKILKKGIATSELENFIQVFYDINIYSNKTNGRKQECKDIAKVIDNFLKSKLFLRVSQVHLPNVDIYRINIKYTAIIDKDFNIYN